MRVLLLSAYDAHSHRQWREELVAALPDIQWSVLHLPPRHFAWRIRGNPLTWLAGSAELQADYDCVLATSMVDLATLRGLVPGLAAVPAVVYFHENQFAYPASRHQQGAVEAQMVQLYSALAAGPVVFNSAHNRDTFLAGVEALLHKLPDAYPADLIDALRQRCQLIPVGVADHWFCSHRDDGGSSGPRGGPLRLVWNHRWEYDKGPALLLAALEAVERRGVDYRIDLLGPTFRQRPVEFDQIAERFSHRIGSFGYEPDRTRYQEILRGADVVISTALHDFQGLAVMEAVACGCRPLVPDRLAYPEWFDAPWRYPSRPDEPETEASGLAERLERVLDPPPPDLNSLRWSVVAERYARLLESAVSPSD